MKTKNRRNPFYLRSGFQLYANVTTIMVSMSQSLLSEVWFPISCPYRHIQAGCSSQSLLSEVWFPIAKQTAKQTAESRNPFYLRSGFQLPRFAPTTAIGVAIPSI